MCDLFSTGNSKSDQQTYSTTTNTSTQLSTQGASAANSPTILTKGDVTITDQGIAKASISGMSDVVQAALSQQSSLNAAELELLSKTLGDQAAANARTSDNGTTLLSSILAANQTLAQNVQSGGATVAMKTTNYIVARVLALAGLVLFLVFWKKT